MKAARFIFAGIIAVISSPLLYGIVADPVLSPSAGSLDAAFSLTVTCSTPGAIIRYTLNGAEPTLFDPTYSAPLTINRTWTVKAKAWAGAETSNTVTGDFQVSGAVSAGQAHSLALKGHGPVVAWGFQNFGRLGNNQTATGNVTTPTSSLYSVGSPIANGSLIATGADHSVFLKNDGSVWDFGYNNKGQLGNNSTINQGLAVQVRKSTTSTDYLTGCVSVAAGTGFSLAAYQPTGEVYAWGDQLLGRLGNGSAAAGFRAYAGKVLQGTGTTPLTGINWVAAGGASALGLNTITGKAWAWGQNTTGQLGQGTSANNLIRAATVKRASGSDLADVTDIACGGDHSAFVCWKAGDPNLQGRVFCVGNQQYGRLGDNVITNTNRLYANQAVLKAVGVPLEYVVQVAAGPGFTLALDSSGNVWAWGRNQKGALGTGNTTDSALAVAVKKPNGTGQLGNIARISAGGFLKTTTPVEYQSFALAVANDGTVYSWGYNGNGQLGNGATSTTAVTLPVVVGGSLDLATYPDVTLACDVNQSAFPGSITLKASPTDPDNNITKVEFFSQGVLVGQVTSAPWELNLNNLTQGTRHNYAVVTDASGYKGYSAPLYFSITWPPPTITLTSTVTTGSAPGAVTLSAVPADPNNAISKVEFFNKGALVGQLTAAPWTLNLSNLASGSYAVTAKVTNAVAQTGNSAASYFTITATPTEGVVDADGDGLSIVDENFLGTSDHDPDTDSDGIPDNIDGTPRVPNSLNFTASALLVTSPLR